MTSRTEELFLAGGPAHKRVVTVLRGTHEVIAGGKVYRDTGQRWRGGCDKPSGRRRLFTRSGTVTYRRRYPEKSLEALACEALGIPPEHVEVRGPAPLRTT